MPEGRADWKILCTAFLVALVSHLSAADTRPACAEPPLSPAPYYQPRSTGTSSTPTLDATAIAAPMDVTEPSAPTDNTYSERGCLWCDRDGISCLSRIRSLLGKSSCGASAVLDEDTALLSPTESRWRIWKQHNRPCKHPICAYPHIFAPFEFYGRMSVVWLVGGGKLDRTLDPGIGAEIGIRQFLYDETKPAAWFGELGFEFTYHNGGEDADLPVFTIREWNVYWVRLALGREWYFGGGQPGDWTVVIGAFTGGRFGSANTKFLDEPYRTDNIGGIFAGGHAGILIPRCGYDLMAQIFTEYGHDWTSWSDLITTDRHIDHIKLGGAIGIRY